MDFVTSVPNEVLLVGCIYKQPDLLVTHGQYIRSKYDFSDETVRFFYDSAQIIYETRTQVFTKTAVLAYFSEDVERLSTYKQAGGWKIIETWMKLADPVNIDRYQNIVKKYSLLREYQRIGIDVSGIMKHRDFEQLNAQDIYRLIRGKVDRIHTVIATNQEAEILNENIEGLIQGCLETPDMGLQIPFPILNDAFCGIKSDTMMCVGMLSNSGKSRFMFKMIAYLALVLKQKCCVLLNEMTIKKMKLCLLATVINNDEFKPLHNINISKKEKEIALGLYKDSKGEFIYRQKDEDGNFTETVEEYEKRISKSSKEYKQIMKVAQWIESETDGLIFAKDMTTGYDDKTLEFEIRKMKIVNDVGLFFYDTLKQDTAVMGDWAALKATTTKLSELAKELNCFVYASIQLTDETIYIHPEEITSAQISNAKQLKHVLDELLLCKEIKKEEFSKYQYLVHDENWGEPVPHDLDQTKRYYVFNVDKNRTGNKPRVVFEVNLDTNEWYEKGEIVRK